MRKQVSLLALAAFLTATVAGAEEYGFDKAHSHIGFSIRHIFVPVLGEFKDYDGSFTFDPKNPSKDKIEVTIQADSISTDNEMRDHDLRSDHFFNVEKYPTITFKSRKVDADGKDQYKVTGDLTIHGVTKPVVLDVSYMGSGKMMGSDLVGFTASTTIDRRDFGLTWGQDKLTDAGKVMVGDQVAITLDISGMDKAGLAKMAAKMKDKPSPASK